MTCPIHPHPQQTPADLVVIIMIGFEPVDNGAKGKSVLPSCRHVGDSDARVPGKGDYWWT